MSTYMPKEGEIVRKWYVLDASGKPMGRVAAQAAVLLRGKHKPEFAPHADCGDHVIIINAEKAVLTGNKLDQKMYYHHNGYIGNMKKVKYSTIMRTKPTFAMELAVKGMIPDTVIGRKALTRLRVYAGTGKVTINDRDIDDYFGLDTLKLIVRQPLELTGTTEKFDVVCRVAGGGVTGQAGAIRHGIARALLQYDESLRPALKKAGFLTRDPRMKERKKYGLKGARRAPQFSKR